MGRKLVVSALVGVLLLACDAAVAQQKGKLVSLSVNKMELPSALSRIERQSGYYKINYGYDELSRYKVSAVIRNSTAPDAVNQLLTGLPYAATVEGKYIQIKRTAKPSAKGRPAQRDQKKGISGCITDVEGEPLVGVTVKVPGTQKMAVTDHEGRYTIADAEPGDQMEVSYIGKRTIRIKSGGRNTNIILDDDKNMLSDIVVTGYQDIQQPKMTGSVTTVSNAKLNERYTPNIMDNLEGRVAGLSTYGGKMTIRGTSSIYAETSPLLVVDGLPIEGSIDDLNPYDIESVNILKDAAATAIYGARASNGIVVITTKRAKDLNKINIDFTANLTVTDKRNYDYADNHYMTPAQQVDAESNYWAYYFFNNDGDVADPIGATESAMGGVETFSPIRMAYYQRVTGSITEEQLNQTLNSLRQNNFAKDFSKYVARQECLQQYNLSLRGRNAKSQHNLTVNYKHDTTGFKEAYSRQFNIGYKGIYDLVSWLTASFSANGIIDRRRGTNSSLATNVFAVPAYMSMYNAAGATTYLAPSYGNPYNEAIENSNVYKSMKFNNVDELSNNITKTRRTYMRYHGGLKFHIIKGLDLNTQFIYEGEDKRQEDYASEDSYLVRSIRNVYTVANADGTYKYLVPQTGGRKATLNTHKDDFTWRAQIDFDRTFGKHDINTIAGTEFRDTKTTGERGLYLGYDDDLQNSLTAATDFSTISTMNYTSLGSTRMLTHSSFYTPYFEEAMAPYKEVHHRYASGYFNVTYTFDGRYVGFFSIRKDYADVYGLNAKYRGKPLWSVGGAWNLQSEKFMKSANFVNLLKLRLSYGVTGNIYQGASSYMTATSGSNNSYTHLPMSVVESPDNPELKWEQTRTTNVGLDFALSGNRLRGSLDWYHKVGKDIFSNMTLDPTTGFSSMFVNAADMKNDGIELQATYDWLRAAIRNGVTWNTTFTLAYNKNEITKVDNPAEMAYQMMNSYPYREGYPVSALFSYRYAGLDDQGIATFYGDNDEVMTNPMRQTINVLVYSGKTEPSTIMGMDNHVEWNGFSLSLLMVYYGGHKMRALQEQMALSNVTTGATPSYFLNGWTPDNPTGSPGYGRYAARRSNACITYADRYVYDASFVKIRNVVFGYDLPRQLTRKWGINGVSLRFQINNPKWLWIANDKNIDPETLSVRNPSSYVFGLNVNL